MWELRERCHDHLLVRKRSPRDDGRRRRRVEAVVQQLRTDLGQRAQAHEDDGGLAAFLGRAAAEDADARRDASVRERDTGRSGHGGERRHAGDDLEGDARFGEREGLLAAAAVHERVAALEAHDGETCAAELDEQPVHVVLRQACTADDECGVGRLRDELRRDEPVVDERVAVAHELQAARRDQARIAGAGADEPDGHDSARSTSFSKYALRAP